MYRSENETVVPDLWGRIMADYENGLEALYSIRRDDGYLSDDHSPEVYFATVDEFFDWEMELLAAASGPVLDIGAGPGRMALWAQDQGMDVVAVESSEQTARVAKAKGVRDVRSGRWQDLDSILQPHENQFGTVFLMGHNLGLGGTRTGLGQLLGRLRSLTRPGGVLLATSIEYSATDDETHLNYQANLRATGAYPGEETIRVEYEHQVGEYFPWLLIESHDLAPLAQEAGWFMEGLVVSDEGPYGTVLRAL
jgi:SAM-dependent methyltransferase